MIQEHPISEIKNHANMTTPVVNVYNNIPPVVYDARQPNQHAFKARPNSPLEGSTTLVFQDLSLTSKKGVSIPEKETKDICVSDYRLCNVNGYVQSGQILAVMGSSGAGKSTLMDILSGTEKHNKNQLGGNVFIMNYKSTTTGIGYVTQEAVFMPTLTVQETLWTHAQLRLPSSTLQHNKENRVSEILEQMGLQHVRHVKVGDQTKKGISGGEKKRLQIGIELLQQPDILFLDEPTSGLDSQNAEKMIGTLRTLADKGCAIVCTIHQPRYSIFYKIDNLLLLSRGMVMYFGPSRKATNYFREMIFLCPSEENPADFLIDLITPGTCINGGDPLLPTEENVPATALKFKHSSYGISLDDSLNRMSEITMFKEIPKRRNSPPTSVVNQVLTLIKRSLKNYIREPNAVLARLGEAVFVALLIGSIFWKTDNISDTSGALFFCVLWVAITAFSSTSFFISDRLLANQEYGSGVYSVEAYYISSMLLNMVVILMFDALFAGITYTMIDLNGFLEYFTILFLVHIITESGIIFASVLFNTVEEAFFMSSLLIVFPILFSGYFRQIQKLPAFWDWAHHISWTKYSMLRALDNQFEDPAVTQVVYQSLGYDTVDMSTSEQYAVLASFAIFWRLMPYFAMRIKARMKGKI